MSSSIKVLAVIPARGGSKGVPRKNIRKVGGKPLIAYTIETAVALKSLFHRIVVSTDDEEIARVAEQFGAEIPFIRPPELAGDKVKMIPVLQHTVRAIEEMDQVQMDWVMLLQPTAPFRSQEDIRAAMEIAESSKHDSVISVVQVFAVHPVLMKKIENNSLLPYMVEEVEGTRRQDYNPPAYMRNGAIYLTRRNVLMNQSSIWGKSISPLVMPEERSVSVDSEMDMKLVELILQERAAKENG